MGTDEESDGTTHRNELVHGRSVVWDVFEMIEIETKGTDDAVATTPDKARELIETALEEDRS